ncbi:Hypothetical predicted protein [Cloeon dipterum]|uniref:Uncharacterized protein n=1 Tax=Cloeon dipterum TaxID=197152 RepID=A0A8S1CQZ1_9INSE|nr:Hypothetical predicted protein [Cloeon dipterum]
MVPPPGSKHDPAGSGELLLERLTCGRPVEAANAAAPRLPTGLPLAELGWEYGPYRVLVAAPPLAPLDGERSTVGSSPEYSPLLVGASAPPDRLRADARGERLPPDATTPAPYGSTTIPRDPIAPTAR